MLADPQSVTYDSVAYSCPRVGNDASSAVYRSADNDFEIRTGHTVSRGGRKRSVISVRRRKVAEDPFNSTLNAEYSTTVALTINEPVVGFTTAERALLIDTVLDYLRTSTDAVPLAIAAGQL